MKLESVKGNGSKMIEKDKHKIKYFIIGIVVGFLIMLCGVVSNKDFTMGVGIALMGIVVVLFPFTTPDTVAILGYPKSKLVGRILGLILIIVGIWVGFI